MRVISVEVEIPDECILGPAFVVTFIDPKTDMLYASARINLDGMQQEFKNRFTLDILTMMRKACETPDKGDA